MTPDQPRGPGAGRRGGGGGGRLLPSPWVLGALPDTACEHKEEFRGEGGVGILGAQVGGEKALFSAHFLGPAVFSTEQEQNASATPQRLLLEGIWMPTQGWVQEQPSQATQQRPQETWRSCSLYPNQPCQEDCPCARRSACLTAGNPGRFAPEKKEPSLPTMTRGVGGLRRLLPPLTIITPAGVDSPWESGRGKVGAAAGHPSAMSGLLLLWRNQGAPCVPPPECLG